MSHPEKEQSSYLPANIPPNSSNGIEPARFVYPQAMAGAFGDDNDKPSGPPAVTAPPSAQTIWYALKRRWLTAVLVGLLGGAVIAFLMMQLIPGQYTASALIQVAPPVSFPDLGDTHWDLRAFRENQQAILKSSGVLNDALNYEDVKDLPDVQQQIDGTSWLREQFKVDFNEAPSIMRITMKGDDPEQLKLLTNAVANSYIVYAREAEKEKREHLLTQMMKTVEDSQSIVQKNTSTLALLRKQRNLPDPKQVEKNMESLDKQMELTRDSLTKKELEEISLQNKLNALQKTEQALRADDIEAAEIELFVQEHLRVKSIEAAKENLDKLIANASRDFVPSEAKKRIQSYQNQRKMLDKDYEDYKADQMPKLRQKKIAETETQISLVKSELAAVKEQQKRLEEHIDSISDKKKNMKARPLLPEEMRLQGEIDLAKSELPRLRDRVNLVKLALNSGSNITLLQPAETPRKLDRSRQIKYAGAGGIGAFLLLVLGVALLECRSRKINGTKDVSHGLGMEVVGTIPSLPPRVRRPIAAPTQRDKYWLHMLTESVDSLRTMLLHSAQEENLQIVMVTSAQSGEGKTSIATQLAASLARAWKKTLLIDGDLRNPAIHQTFNQELEPGLCEVLRGEVSVDEAIHSTTVGRLWAMPAGQWDSHAIQALAQEDVGNIFKEMKEKFDFIIVDSSPVLPVADTLLLGQHADAVVFSVLRDVSRAPSVYAAQQRLSTLGIRFLGAVLIGEGAPGAAYSYPVVAGS